MTGERLARYAEAIEAKVHMSPRTKACVARAVVAVADEEHAALVAEVAEKDATITELRAEVERLTLHVEGGSPEATERPRTPIDEAVEAWEEHGPTSLTVALLADAIYGARDATVAIEAEHDRLRGDLRIEIGLHEEMTARCQRQRAEAAEAKVAKVEALHVGHGHAPDGKTWTYSCLAGCGDWPCPTASALADAPAELDEGYDDGLCECGRYGSHLIGCPADERAEGGA